MTRKVSLFLFTTLLFSCGSIYNLNGSLVKTLYNNVRMNKGNNSSPINASELSMGTYLVVVKAGEEQEVVKFIKY